MEILSTVSIIISVGSAIGLAVAVFFAQRKSQSEKVLRATVEDYKTRTEQLEADGIRKDKTIADQGDRIKSLEREKKLPLDKLTTIVIENQSQTISILNTVVNLLQNQQNAQPSEGKVS